MVKKIFMGMSAVALAVASVPMFAAFEAHVINVTAQIENALSVVTTPIDFGTVFPEETFANRFFAVRMSSSFLEEDRVDDIEYVVKQKPKCRVIETGAYIPVETQFLPGGLVAHRCPGGSVQLPSLCPYLSKAEVTQEDVLGGNNDGPPIPPLHDPNNPETWGRGRLAVSEEDREDQWLVDLLVPCFKGQCAQDNLIPPQYQLPCDDLNQDGQCDLNGAVFGCDLWVEVTGISEAE